MRWTKNKPTKPGKYWYRESGLLIYYAEIKEDGWGRFYGIREIHVWPVKNLRGEFSSDPIPLPEESDRANERT